MNYIWRISYVSNNRVINSGRAIDYDAAHAAICSHRGVRDSVTWTTRNDIDGIYVGRIVGALGNVSTSRQCCIMRVKDK